MENYEEYNKRKLEEHNRKHKMYTDVACPNCEHELRRKSMDVAMSSPKRATVFCENCEFTGSIIL